MSNNENNQFPFYLNNLNIKMNQDVLMLTSHYYYSFDEIRHVNAIVHTKELNRVNDLQMLMSTIMRGLSNGTKFIGCFVDNKIYKNKIRYWFLHFNEIGNSRYISRKQMIKLFSKYGLQIVDMTEVEGVTYFCVKRH